MSLNRFLCVVGAALLLVVGGTQAAVIVSATVTPAGGGVFHYEISVTNGELADLVLVSIMDAPLADPLIDLSLVSPVGFFANYDDGLGIVDFLGDTQLFYAGTTTSGFAFDSFGPPTLYFQQFEALTSLGGVISGTITYPGGGLAEPEAWVLVSIGLAGLGLARRRKAG